MDTQINEGTTVVSEKKDSSGIVGIIIVIIILIAGGLLLIKDEKASEFKSSVDSTTNIEVSSEDEFAVPVINDTSDDTASIVEDVDDMDFSNIDQGL